LEVLGKRLGRFGLWLHPDKTRFIDFRPARPGGMHADGKHDPEKLQTFRTRSCARFKAPSFDFLGFTPTWMKSRKGKNVVRQRTAKSRLARALAAVNDWCRKNRHQPVADQHAKLSAKLIGHYAWRWHTRIMKPGARHRAQRLDQLWVADITYIRRSCSMPSAGAWSAGRWRPISRRGSRPRRSPWRLRRAVARLGFTRHAEIYGDAP
jgi:hypothetical protein